MDVRRGAAALLALGMLAAACQSGEPTAEDRSPPAGTPETSPSPTPAPDDRIALEVWFTRDAELFAVSRSVPRTEAVGAAAVEELLGGPNGPEASAGVGTAVPPGARLLGLDVQDGMATVDLSREFEPSTGTTGELLTVAQVVYTLTQFPTVDAVRFRLEGEPVAEFASHGLDLRGPQRREDYEQLLPAIAVTSLAIGQEISSPVTVAGNANVFEATVSIRILDGDGEAIRDTFTTATCGSGCRGDYSEDVSFEVTEAQPGTVMVFEVSAETGEPVNVVRIPVTLAP